MNKKALTFTVASLLLASIGVACACEYIAGETKFIDYANCRYGEDSVEVVQLGDDFAWDECIYFLQPFTPAKLLAVTRDKKGKEVVSVSNRSQIGNPCYMTKRACDAALQEQMQ